MGCTHFGEHWDKNSDDLAIDACYEAFDVTFAQILGKTSKK
jgi:hypothetical protein